jgi:hypothetical protein
LNLSCRQTFLSPAHRVEAYGVDRQIRRIRQEVIGSSFERVNLAFTPLFILLCLSLPNMRWNEFQEDILWSPGAGAQLNINLFPRAFDRLEWVVIVSGGLASDDNIIESVEPVTAAFAFNRRRQFI